LARDYLVIRYTNTHLDLIKYSNILDFYYDLIRNHVIIRHTGKNLKATRIPDMRTRVLRYNYNYVAEVMAEVLT